MLEFLLKRRTTITWIGPLTSLAVLAIFVVLVASTTQANLHAQPELLALAAQRPDQTLNVIVQKQAADTRVEALVRQLGGTITKDLHIINAFAAEMKGRDVSLLARADGVRWVSLDSPLVQNAGASCATPVQLTNLVSIRANRNQAIMIAIPQRVSVQGGVYDESRIG
jgi:hypothetical protein